MEEINIKEYLRSCSLSKGVYYCANAGNAGDSLIACATFQIFRDSEVPYQLYDWRKTNLEGKIFVYGGGGNLVSYYGDALRIIESVHQKVKKLIILPHTINHHESLLKSFGSNVDIICREKVSYNYVKNKSPHANVMLMHDLVFNLKVDELLTRNSDNYLETIFLELIYMIKKKKHLFLNFPTLKELKYTLRKEAKLFRLRHNGNLNCFRTDCESANLKLPVDNIDVSNLLSYKKIINRANAVWVSNQLIRLVNSFAKIKTDRLHIAICAALLNKEVYFYKNSYYKNEAIYRFSFEKQFPNVRWMG
ncbi:MAG: polysaccharide pyruvyl transferase family protein [Candidatus Omnitrophica bacterium]|nr:polysaccharide pyruvyl transferase family protein [Candidatus Omnitrophota bacterium]